MVTAVECISAEAYGDLAGVYSPSQLDYVFYFRMALRIL
jgi:hypothetical protein